MEEGDTRHIGGSAGDAHHCRGDRGGGHGQERERDREREREQEREQEREREKTRAKECERERERDSMSEREREREHARKRERTPPPHMSQPPHTNMSFESPCRWAQTREREEGIERGGGEGESAREGEGESERARERESERERERETPPNRGRIVIDGMVVDTNFLKSAIMGGEGEHIAQLQTLKPPQTQPQTLTPTPATTQSQM